MQFLNAPIGKGVRHECVGVMTDQYVGCNMGLAILKSDTQDGKNPIFDVEGQRD